MITLKHDDYEIHDEVSNNDKVQFSFIKKIFSIILLINYEKAIIINCYCLSLTIYYSELMKKINQILYYF